MKRMKVIFNIFVVALIMCILSGCGQFNDAIGSIRPSDPTEPSPGPNTDDPEKSSFSVSLIYDGMPYSPSVPMSAQWTDGKSFHSAEFDENGVAKITGLDGDYNVTLSNLPDGYTYNPNIYVSTNRSKDITIELYKYTKPRTGGGSLYNCVSINKLTVYRAELVGSSSVVYYEFKPSKSGTYTIESWVNIEPNAVNPILDEYTGSSQAKYFYQTTDDGGISSTYTKNFKYVIQIDEKMIGNSFTFGVKAESETEFPVTIDFAVQLDGGFSENWTTSVLMFPYENLKKVSAPANATLVGPEIQLAKDQYRFDGTLFGLNEEDGYYHRINPATGEYTGELLFAYITSSCRFIDDPLSTIEYHGNKALTVTSGTENYKFFIEGNHVQNFFCVNNTDPASPAQCPCIVNGCGGVCVYGCPDCMSQCRNVTAEEKKLIEKGGYADYANSDGLCPVTEELKEFLQKFSISQRYFNDGNGWVEENDVINIDSLEDDQWLFCCAYYRGFTNLD